MPPGRERERQTGKGGENGGILPRKPEGCTKHPGRETVSETKRERPAQGGTMDGGGRAQYLHELTFALRAIESRKRRNRREVYCQAPNEYGSQEEKEEEEEEEESSWLCCELCGIGGLQALHCVLALLFAVYNIFTPTGTRVGPHGTSSRPFRPSSSSARRHHPPTSR